MAAKKRAGRQYEAQKQLAAWRDEKRKAEEMLLMQPLSSQHMQEEPDYDETSAINEADIAGVNRTTGFVAAEVDTLVQSKFTQEESKKNTTVKTSIYASNQVKMDRAQYSARDDFKLDDDNQTSQGQDADQRNED